VRWLGIALLLAACNENDSFHAPNPGNLFKSPYDFAAEKYPRDLNFDEDMAVNINDDLAGADLSGDDLNVSRDMKNITTDHDLSGH
jgi:hypothetical protein